jgi:hypothetical protein
MQLRASTDHTPRLLLLPCNGAPIIGHFPSAAAPSSPVSEHALRTFPGLYSPNVF